MFAAGPEILQNEPDFELPDIQIIRLWTLDF